MSADYSVYMFCQIERLACKKEEDELKREIELIFSAEDEDDFLNLDENVLKTIFETIQLFGKEYTNSFLGKFSDEGFLSKFNGNALRQIVAYCGAMGSGFMHNRDRKPGSGPRSPEESEQDIKDGAPWQAVYAVASCILLDRE